MEEMYNKLMLVNQNHIKMSKRSEFIHWRIQY